MIFTLVAVAAVIAVLFVPASRAEWANTRPPSRLAPHRLATEPVFEPAAPPPQTAGKVLKRRVPAGRGQLARIHARTESGPLAWIWEDWHADDHYRRYRGLPAAGPCAVLLLGLAE